VSWKIHEAGDLRHSRHSLRRRLEVAMGALCVAVRGQGPAGSQAQPDLSGGRSGCALAGVAKSVEMCAFGERSKPAALEAGIIAAFSRELARGHRFAREVLAKGEKASSRASE